MDTRKAKVAEANAAAALAVVAHKAALAAEAWRVAEVALEDVTTAAKVKEAAYKQAEAHRRAEQEKAAYRAANL